MLLVNLITLLFQKVANYNVIASMYCGLAFELLALIYQQDVKTMRMRSRMLRQGFSAMLDYRNAPDEALIPLYPDPSRVRMLSSEMEAYRIGPFAR
jgi:hypothetical protein